MTNTKLSDLTAAAQVGAGDLLYTVQNGNSRRATVAQLGAAVDSENRIINGAFDFWQRGTSHTGNGYGSADRWFNRVDGGSVTMERVSFSPGASFVQNNPRFFLRQSVSGQSGTNFASIRQLIEGVRSYAGETITILGWAQRISGNGDIRVRVVQNFGTGGSPSASVNTPSQLVTLAASPSWTPFAVVIDVPSIAGQTVGTDGNDSLILEIITSDGSGPLGIQTISVGLWGIHIRHGTHSSAAVAMYNAPELGPELQRCQRFYETGRYRFGSAAVDAGGTVATRVYFRTAKRANAASVSRTDTTLTNAAASSVSNGSTDGFDIAAAGLTSGSRMDVAGTWAVDTEL